MRSTIITTRAHFHDKRCEMSVRIGQLAIAFHANVAVTNGRFTPLPVKMPTTYRKPGDNKKLDDTSADD